MHPDPMMIPPAALKADPDRPPLLAVFSACFCRPQETVKCRDSLLLLMWAGHVSESRSPRRKVLSVQHVGIWNSLQALAYSNAPDRIWVLQETGRTFKCSFQRSCRSAVCGAGHLI
ncbi:hypothetical protein CgunFtcFv8_001437 [Champsocephalus gunnari]|uniref:Uncharacterized protein n=1 Tax=Champsocephalus gunnari TaxID=52237 RepID=A0AAN8CND2_CHAGU|nr:hypothetical protein CgunFtcFv8_001437 [Champsocephalus gunnari]